MLYGRHDEPILPDNRRQAGIHYKVESGWNAGAVGQIRADELYTVVSWGRIHLQTDLPAGMNAQALKLIWF